MYMYIDIPECIELSSAPLEYHEHSESIDLSIIRRDETNARIVVCDEILENE